MKKLSINKVKVNIKQKDRRDGVVICFLPVLVLYFLKNNWAPTCKYVLYGKTLAVYVLYRNPRKKSP